LSHFFSVDAGTASAPQKIAQLMSARNRELGRGIIKVDRHYDSPIEKKAAKFGNLRSCALECRPKSITVDVISRHSALALNEMSYFCIYPMLFVRWVLKMVLEPCHYPELESLSIE
jgi:hypothetical protein